MTTTTMFDVDDDFDGKQINVEEEEKNKNIYPRFVRIDMDGDRAKEKEQNEWTEETDK